jgi:superfamily I DNA and/or RNA helicase
MDVERRLNVAWTGAKYGRIVIGDRKTLEHHEHWKDALQDCEEVILPGIV